MRDFSEAEAIVRSHLAKNYTLYTPLELERQLADSGAEAIVVLENFAFVAKRWGVALAVGIQEALPGRRSSM